MKFIKIFFICFMFLMGLISGVSAIHGLFDSVGMSKTFFIVSLFLLNMIVAFVATDIKEKLSKDAAK